MAHGHPDYGIGAPLKTIYTLEDMAELAARLGSFVTFDRRGNIIFLDDFDSLTKTAYWRLGIGGGGTVNISNLWVLYGQSSCKLVAEANDWVEVTYQLAFPSLSRMGFEFAWNRLDEGNLEDIYFEVGLNDGTNWWYASLRWTAATGIWQCYDSAGLPVDLEPVVKHSADVVAFNHVKLVADFVEKKYVRLIDNNLIFDLSHIALNKGDAVVPAYIYIVLQTRANAGGDATNYINHIIITQNEP